MDVKAFDALVKDPEVVGNTILLLINKNVTFLEDRFFDFAILDLFGVLADFKHFLMIFGLGLF